MSNTLEQKNSLRRLYRSRRRSLSDDERQQAAQAIAKTLLELPIYKLAEHIGVYSAMPGEIPLDIFVQEARKHGKQIYLPSINTQKPDNQMIFCAWRESQKLIPNQYGVQEPGFPNHHGKAPLLDLILMPLVAYDACGHRLGMGGGYYDRYFARLFRNNLSKKDLPYRLGIAHSCQYSSILPKQEWDIDLQALVNEKTFLEFT